MSLVDVDTWLTEYEACERLSRDIQSLIASRNREARLSDEYSKISASARIRLKQFSAELSQLNTKLGQYSVNSKLTAEEKERRQRQIESLQSKLIHLQNQFTNIDQTNRSDLFQPTGSRLWEDEDEQPIIQTENYTVHDLRKQQTKILDNQDEGLEALSKIISRQKDLALKIGDEVDVQNDLIDDLADTMERTDTRISHETRHVGTVAKKDTTWGYWIIIVTLFIAICVVSLI